MKKQFLLLLCTGWLFLPTQANIQRTSIPGNTEITETDPIDLEGTLKDDGIRSAGDPIIAQKQGNIIHVTFFKQLGDLSLALTTNVNAQVYSITVGTSVQQDFIVPLSDLPEGVSTIPFSPGRGMMYGDIEI